MADEVYVSYDPYHLITMQINNIQNFSDKSAANVLISYILYSRDFNLLQVDQNILQASLRFEIKKAIYANVACHQDLRDSYPEVLVRFAKTPVFN